MALSDRGLPHARFAALRDDRGILAGQLSAVGGLHRSPLPRGQGGDFGVVGRDPGASGQQRGRLASAVAEAGRGAVAGPVLRGDASAVMGSGPAPGRASPDQPGRLRGALSPDGTAKPFLSSKWFGKSPRRSRCRHFGRTSRTTRRIFCIVTPRPRRNSFFSHSDSQSQPIKRPGVWGSFTVQTLDGYMPVHGESMSL